MGANIEYCWLWRLSDKGPGSEIPPLMEGTVSSWDRFWQQQTFTTTGVRGQQLRRAGVMDFSGFLSCIVAYAKW